MTTTLGMAILGSLARAPLTGYEITRSVKGVLHYFWHASHSQVYPELARLEAAALVQVEHIPQLGKPDQKRYTPTQAGLDALAAWLVGPLEPTSRRSEMAVRAYCSAYAVPQQAADMFARQAGQHAQRLAQFEAYRAHLDSLPDHPVADLASAEFADYSVVMRGIAMEQAQAQWCDWMAQRLHGDR
ncbi:MAG: PadR family transcriptional regulator [Pseudomonadota bacterium]